MRSADTVSTRQRAILNFVGDFVASHKYPPSIRQIQEALKISSTSVVAYNLKVLEEKGLLQRESRVSRGIALARVESESVQRGIAGRVPLLGAITAGSPLPNPQDTSEAENELIEVPVDVASAEKLKDVYALKVRGHSMIDALIDDGDIVLLRYQQTAENGQMVAVRILDENAVTLKRFYLEGDRVKLQPANVTMEPWYENSTNVRIEGRVIGVLRSMA